MRYSNGDRRVHVDRTRVTTHCTVTARTVSVVYMRRDTRATPRAPPRISVTITVNTVGTTGLLNELNRRPKLARGGQSGSPRQSEPRTLISYSAL